MQRYGPALVALALLVATATAFVVTQRKKLTEVPVALTGIENRYFSPACRCPTSRTTLELTVREPEVLTVRIVDGGDVVRTLVRNREVPRGQLELPWDGRTDTGAIAPDGAYHPRVELGRSDRTFELTNEIELDTQPPTATLERVRPRVLTEGPGRRFVVEYSFDEPARAYLFVDGTRRVKSRFRREDDALAVFSRVVGAGVHRLRLLGEDRAGNFGAPTRSVRVLVRPG